MPPMRGFLVCVEDVDERHIEPYAELSRLEYGSQSAVSDPTHLRWKFLANPAGPAKGVHLFKDGTLVGRLVAQPRLFDGDARTTKAAYIVDLLIHPEHRGMASLRSLLGGFAQLREWFDLVLVTPNAQGMLVWEQFVKLPSWFDLNVYAFPLRPARLFARPVRRPLAFLISFVDAAWRGLTRAGAKIAALRSSVRIDATWPDEGELDSLLDSFASETAIHGRRDRAFFDWRFRRSPLFRYDVLFVRNRDRLVGYVASRRTTYGSYDTRFLVDIYLKPELTKRDRSAIIWAFLRREVGPGGPDLALILGNTACGPLARIARWPFVAVPARFLPQRTAVFADWWTTPQFGLAAKELVLTLADCDMI
jgi:hypothetical protein